MKLNSKIAFRLLFYIAGQLLVAFGVAFAIKGDLGISPVSSPSYAIFNTLQHNGIYSITYLLQAGNPPGAVVSQFQSVFNITYGTCVTAVYLLYIVVQILILRRQFKLINLFQIVVSTVFGWFVDFTTAIVGPPMEMAYPLRLLLLALSILLIAVGLSFYLGAKVLPMPSEGMGLAITDKLKKYPYHRIKIVLDCLFVASAIAITFFGIGRVMGVREGTVLTAVLVGPVMGLLKPLLQPLIQRLGFGAGPDTQEV